MLHGTMVLALLIAATLSGCTQTKTPTNDAVNASVRDEPARTVVAARAEDVRPVKVGERAPVLTLGSHEGTPVDLAQVYAQGPTMLIFYRGSWCPYCSAHLSEVARHEAALRDMGVHVVAISPDSPEAIAAHQLNDAEMNYTLLSDAEAEAAIAFGLAFRVDDGTVEKYRGYGIDLDQASGHDHHVLPVPAVYLVDAAGVVRFAHWNPDYKQRLGGEALIQAAETVTGGETSSGR